MKLRFCTGLGLLLAALVYSVEQRLEAQDSTAPRKATITGRVLNAATGEPIRKAHLALSKPEASETEDGVAPVMAATTNTDGYFSLEGIEPGSYRLSAQRNGFAATEYGAAGERAGTTLTLTADQKLDLTLKMVPLGVIAGRVLDGDGDAVPNAVVSAIHIFFAGGKRQIERHTRVRSNDLGEYRLYDLPAGRYYIAASIPSSSAEAAQPPDEDSGLIYYQNATDLGNATPLELAAGGVLSNIDMLATRTRRVTVSGSVANAPAGSSVMVYLMPRDSALPLKFIRQDAEYHDDTGRFEIHSVAPGVYTLVANAAGAVRKFSARQQLAVSGSEVQDILLSLSPGVDLHGRLSIEGVTAPASSHLGVTLQSRDEGNAGVSPVAADGSFTVANVVPNTYVLSISGLAMNCYVKSVRAGEQEFAPSEVDLTHGVAGPLSIVISATAGQVGGVVMNDKQQPAGSALVVLIPAQRQRGDLYKSTTTNPTGGFSLRGVTPGDYKLFAWQGIDTGAYEDPDFLKRFEDQGEPVSLGENGSRSVQLKVIPGASF
jgi:protocatechuate 3,4-dioxygenase beta subunit